MAESPIALVGSLLFILGVTVGLLLLGLAMWRSHAAPAWMGIALAVGGFTHPFMPGHVAAGIGLLVAAVGFAGASRALLTVGQRRLRPAARRQGRVSLTARHPRG